jgi:rootletin
VRLFSFLITNFCLLSYSIQKVDSLNIDYEKLQHINSKLQKAVDSLEEEKKSLLNDLKRITNDKDIQEMNLR